MRLVRTVGFLPVGRSKEFIIPVENQAGALADITTSLARADINIAGFLCEGGGQYGVLRIVTDKPTETEAMLKATRQAFRVNDVLSVRVPNRPGELARITQRLAASGVNVDAAYPTAAPDGRTDITFAVSDLRSAEKLLG